MATSRMLSPYHHHSKMGYVDGPYSMKSHTPRNNYISSYHDSLSQRGSIRPQVPLARPHSRGRSSMDATSPATGTSSNQRRRIAVACMRCRKRKIRCSGDPGDRTGCTNCKSAGETETCQFLRVASTALDMASTPSVVSVPSAPPPTSFYNPQTHIQMSRPLSMSSSMYMPRASYDHSDSGHSGLGDSTPISLYSSAYPSTRTSISGDALSGDMGDSSVLHSASSDSMYPESQGNGYSRHDLRALPTRSDSNYYDNSVTTSTFSLSPHSGPSRASSIGSGAYDYSGYASSTSLAGLSSSVPLAAIAPEKILTSNDPTTRFQLPHPPLASSAKYSMDAPKPNFMSSMLSSSYSNTGSTSVTPYSGWGSESYTSSVPYSSASQKSSSGYASAGTDHSSQTSYASSYSNANSGYASGTSSAGLIPTQGSATGSPESLPAGSIISTTSTTNSDATVTNGQSQNNMTSSPPRDTSSSFLDIGSSSTSITVGK